MTYNMLTRLFTHALIVFIISITSVVKLLKTSDELRVACSAFDVELVPINKLIIMPRP